MISKRRKVGATSAAASGGSCEEVESDAEGVPPTTEEVGEMETTAIGRASATDLDADLMASTVQGLGGGPITATP